MGPRFITHNNFRIACYQFGNGPRLVFCFHGYGENATYFSFLEKYAGDKFSFIAIDLPFHGKTMPVNTGMNEAPEFGWKDLKEVIDEIYSFAKEKPGIKKDKTILLGFSLGGRIALSLYQSVPDGIEKVVLLAPDGLKVNFWYWLSTQTWIGRKLFILPCKTPVGFLAF